MRSSPVVESAAPNRPSRRIDEGAPPRDRRTVVLAARAGDRRALEELVAAVLPMVRSTARRHAVVPADVDDVVQETLATLVARLDDVRSPDAIEGWLWKVTVNAAHTIGRRHRRTTGLTEADEPAAPDGFEDRFVDAEVRLLRSAAVVAAFDRLEPAERRLLILLAQEHGPSYAEVSRVVGCPVGTIGPTRQRAINRIRSDPAVRRLRDSGVVVRRVVSGRPGGWPRGPWRTRG